MPPSQPNIPPALPQILRLCLPVMIGETATNKGQRRREWASLVEACPIMRPQSSPPGNLEPCRDGQRSPADRPFPIFLQSSSTREPLCYTAALRGSHSVRTDRGPAFLVSSVLLGCHFCHFSLNSLQARVPSSGAETTKKTLGPEPLPVHRLKSSLAPPSNTRLARRCRWILPISFPASVIPYLFCSVCVFVVFCRSMVETFPLPVSQGV
jgi:hypothetical protein